MYGWQALDHALTSEVVFREYALTWWPRIVTRNYIHQFETDFLNRWLPADPRSVFQRIHPTDLQLVFTLSCHYKLAVIHFLFASDIDMCDHRDHLAHITCWRWLFWVSRLIYSGHLQGCSKLRPTFNCKLIISNCQWYPVTFWRCCWVIYNRVWNFWWVLNKEWNG